MPAIERLHLLEEVRENMKTYVDEVAAPDAKMKNEIMVMLERPPAADVPQVSDSGKDAVLYTYAKQQRDNLIDWIKEQGLANQLIRIDEPTTVNLLRMEGTPTLTAALQYAPSILSVALVGDFEVTLLEA